MENKYIKDKYIEDLKKPYKLDEDYLAINLVKPNSKVLSAGCGAGREVNYLVNKLNCEVVAVDKDEEMLKLNKANADYILANLEDFRSEDKFDYIICLNNTINYLKDRRRFIENCWYNLKPKGWLILVTSDIFGSWRFPLANLKRRNKYYYFPSQINNWFRGLGFKVNKLKLNKTNLVVAEK